MSDFVVDFFHDSQGGLFKVTWSYGNTILGGRHYHMSFNRIKERSGTVRQALQDLVDARFDVTVVYVRGGIFAFELDRAAFTDKSVDWREVGELDHDLTPPGSAAKIPVIVVVATQLPKSWSHHRILEFVTQYVDDNIQIRHRRIVVAVRG